MPYDWTKPLDLIRQKSGYEFGVTNGWSKPFDGGLLTSFGNEFGVTDDCLSLMLLLVIQYI